MPRGARIDAAGILHHVMVRGIERRQIFSNDDDRGEFLARLEGACEKTGARVYAWCLMPNHVHLAIRTGQMPLQKTMRSLLTGYAVYFNRRHRRHGHLFQNRYKSILVDEEEYFLTLVRYIHLNPVRARLVESVDALESYPWTGHSVLMGKGKYSVQDSDAVLRRFGRRAGDARKSLVEFMKMDEAKKETKIFEGGGLRRSAGGVKKLLEAGNKEKWVHDERILGSSSFVESVLKNTEKDQRTRTLSPEKQRATFDRVADQLCERFEVTRPELLGGGRRRAVSESRRLLSYVANRHLGMTLSEVGEALNVSKVAVLKAVTKTEEEWDDLDWLSKFIE